MNLPRLNTNFNFATIDGYPRVSMYTTDYSDNDQRFGFIDGAHGGKLIKHLSTGLCVNAARIQNDAQFNLWPCNPNDIDQNWDYYFNPQNGELVSFRRTGTNHCIDIPGDTRRGNNGTPVLWDCHYLQHQRFRLENQTQPSQIVEVDERVNHQYRLVIGVINPSLINATVLGVPIKDAGEIGHAWVGLVHWYSIDKVRYQNGVEISRTRNVDGLNEFVTLSAAGVDFPVPYTNSEWERKMTGWFLATGNKKMFPSRSDIGMDRGVSVADEVDRVYGKRKLSFLEVNISHNQFLEYLPQNLGGRGAQVGECNSYNWVPDNNPATCQCSSFATRLFTDLTGNTYLSEFFLNDPIGNPLGLGTAIDLSNGL